MIGGKRENDSRFCKALERGVLDVHRATVTRQNRKSVVQNRVFPCSRRVRFIFEDLAYCSEYFGEYDSHRAGFDRHYVKKVERIGKKYQWIAMYNVLARLSDVYRVRGWDWDDKKGYAYEGPWEPYVRVFWTLVYLAQRWKTG